MGAYMRPPWMSVRACYRSIVVAFRLLGMALTLLFSAGYCVQVPDAHAQMTMCRTDMKITKSLGNLGWSGGGEVALVLQNVFQDNHKEYSNTLEVGNLLFDRRAYFNATTHL